jgi:alpha-D-xyloside xylohydrolase
MRTVLGVVFLSFLIGNPHMFCQSVQKEPDGIIVTAPEEVNGIKKLRIKVWDDKIIQVVSSPTNEFSSQESLIITGEEKTSTKWNVSDIGDRLNLSTNSITVKIDKNNLRVSFFDKHGQLIMTENNKEIQAAKDFSENCWQIKQSFISSNGETLYGLGSFQDADIALNGKKITLYQKNRDDVVPVIISTNHYGLLWENYSYSEFNDIRGSYYLWSEVADEINYYFMYGEKIDSIVSSYRQLTGKAPM